MKHLRLFESFEDIDSICKKFGITNYTINSDGTVDVNGDVDLRWHNMVVSSKGLTKLPLKFGKVTGDFYCNDNQLITLEGSPREVTGNFNCNYNKLTTLKGGPQEVGGDFNCNYNKLITLEGSPREVGGYFYCYNNKLTSLEGGPREVGGHFNCSDNPIYSVYRLFSDHKSFMDSLDYNYLRGTDIVKSRFEEALDEIGKKMPEKIKGYNYI
jgi:hypothetical protein